jgi:uncharacterized protein YndB with AHSA1/START domain
MAEDNPGNVSDREIVTTRIFDAPRELVWQAWSDPAHLQHWWGPKGFSNTFETFEFKPGAVWRFTMHGPDGTDYKNEWIFVEIEKPSRIVLDHMSPPKFRVTATFEDMDGKTRITFQQVFETAAVYENVKPRAVPGNEGMFDRLVERLALIRENGRA